MGNQHRKFLKNDPATIGTGPAMLSSSQKEIKVGDVLYEGSLNEVYRSKRSEEEHHRLEITAHRVVQVNYQYRRVMIRCANGCETSLHYGGDKCSRTKYFHTLEELKADLIPKIDAQIAEELKELEKHKRRAEQLRRLRKSPIKVVKIPAKV